MEIQRTIIFQRKINNLVSLVHTCKGRHSELDSYFT